ncbi:MAG: hypothetical protein ACRD1B_05540 [Thermoanaerobaculia bacterium]
MRRRTAGLGLVLGFLALVLAETPACKRQVSPHPGQPTPFPVQAFTPLPRVPTPTLRPGQAPQPTEFPG